MLNLVINIIDTLKNDPTIASFVGNRVYPQGVDIFPEATANPAQGTSAAFPLITIHTVSEITRTVPLGERETLMQISVWSRLGQLQVEQISERALTVLNFQQFHTGMGTTVLRWQREDAGVDQYESDRRIWHKAITFRAWARP